MFITDKEDFDFKPVWKGMIRLQGDLIYLDQELGFVLAPDGFVCDLASYKVISKVVFDKLGDSMRPAVLHDNLYCTQPEGCTRAVADRIFKESLVLDGTGKVSAYIQWLGVRAGGWVAFNKYAKLLAVKKEMVPISAPGDGYPVM